MALAAYRHLLRAARVAFQGDVQLLQASQSQARQGFQDKRSLDPSSEEANEAIKHAEGVAEILRTNVVQGRRADGEHSYKLNIHKDTERGENDTIKNPLGKDGKVKIGGA
ncbi:uncharacterized protein HMPREF1541_00398 [Cyphellophora europaea CBS 101466]|uniref:Mitochondrial zinc maintenance protein 1, mitochondrial n=1 Tax=Cyphellophora europaea (strain CBS 101466) TaxID=1220924 RepID=W2SE73_CYPE1|nr:uncharacterized protein HMPREF1541_00398 [Cyphellophora europaea CBS 101466]ETN46214.1 hypothetical protein HMPREF1541_00398 [Cyphellophora europaea CBS 101466]